MKWIKKDQLARHHEIVYHDYVCRMYNWHHTDVVMVTDRIAKKIGRPCKRCHQGA